MKKEFEYRGYIFEISIALEISIPSRPYQQIRHKVVTKGISENTNIFKNSELVFNDDLETYLENLESYLVRYVDRLIDGSAKGDERLLALGFK